MVKKQTLRKLKQDVDFYKRRVNSLENKVNVRKMCIGFSIFFLIGLPLLIWGLSMRSINEDTFCLTKLNKHFPEYDFYEANYQPSDGSWSFLYNTCRGYYRTETNIVRDGLEEMNDYEKEYKDYKLLDKQNIKYLDSDNWKWMLIIFGSLSLLISIIIFACWLGEILTIED